MGGWVAVPGWCKELGTTSGAGGPWVVQGGRDHERRARGAACGGAVPGWCKELGTEGEAGGWNGS